MEPQLAQPVHAIDGRDNHDRCGLSDTEERRKGGRYRNRKLRLHMKGRFFLILLVSVMTPIVGWLASGTLFALNGVWLVVAATVLLAVSMSVKYYPRPVHKPSPIQLYPLWPFGIEVVLVASLCILTGGITSCFVSIFFIHAALGYYALERKRDVYLLMLFTVLGLSLCTVATPLLTRSTPSLVVKGFQVSAENRASQFLLLAVTCFNLWFAAAVSWRLSRAVNEYHYTGVECELEGSLEPAYSHLCDCRSVRRDVAEASLNGIVKSLAGKRGAVRRVDRLRLLPDSRSLLINAIFPEKLRHSPTSEGIIRRVYKAGARDLAERLRRSDHNVTEDEPLWVELLLNFDHWKRKDFVENGSTLDPNTRIGYINCTEGAFEESMRDSERRKRWLALLPYCLRPTECEHRKLSISCSVQSRKACPRNGNGEGGPSNACLAHQCYESLSGQGVFTRFVANDELEVQRCVNEFRTQADGQYPEGVIVVCCPRALIENTYWFMDKRYYQRKPVAFFCTSAYGECKYYDSSEREATVQTTFDIQKLRSLFL